MKMNEEQRKQFGFLKHVLEHGYVKYNIPKVLLDFLKAFDGTEHEWILTRNLWNAYADWEIILLEIRQESLGVRRRQSMGRGILQRFYRPTCKR